MKPRDLYYPSGEAVELGDIVDVVCVDETELLDGRDIMISEHLEPDEAEVITVGRRRLRVRWTNENVKPRSEWVGVAECELVRRQG